MEPNSSKGRLKRINKESIKGFLEKRIWLVCILGILITLGIFIGLPYYIVSQPVFFKGFTLTESYYDSWKTSTHAQVVCVRCHAKPTRKDLSVFYVQRALELYVRPVWHLSRPFSWKKPPNEACAVCHAASRRASPSGDLLIPHKAHVEVLKMKCVDCHQYVVHKKNPEGKHTPRMKTCIKCHNGKRATNECKSCHKKKSYPVSHRSKEWLVIHSKKEKEKAENCVKCHGWVKDYCKVCHQRKPVSHAGRWRTFHPEKVKSNRNCANCHKDDFCVRCHGEIP